jgi:hypothetical protein
MLNYWVRVENNKVVECLSYLPEREGDWRQAIDVAPVLISNRQIADGHWFDLTKTPVEVRWDVKDISIEDRKQQLFSNCIFPIMQEVHNQLVEEQNCNNCDLDSGCCIDVVVEKLNEIKQKRAEIFALSSHDELDAYAANIPLT